MKSDFMTGKIGKASKSALRLLPQILLLLFIVLFAFLTYVSIWPKEDSAAKAEGDKRVNSLKINFNQKTYADLNKPSTPGVVAGSRNPFSN